MPKRTFETTQLIEWGIHNFYEDGYVVHFEEVGMSTFEVDCLLVFRAPDDGKLWRFGFQINDGSGYNDITGTSSEYNGGMKPETLQFTAEEVKPVEVTVTKYLPVE